MPVASMTVICTYTNKNEIFDAYCYRLLYLILMPPASSLLFFIFIFYVLFRFLLLFVCLFVRFPVWMHFLHTKKKKKEKEKKKGFYRTDKRMIATCRLTRPPF